MREAIEECYDRFGRYLNPDLGQDLILMGSENRYKPYRGRCARTGVEADIIDHHKAESGGVVPTHTKLLWMIAYQNRLGKSSYRLSFGCIAFLPDEILSSAEWADRNGRHIPRLRVLTTKEIIRCAIACDRYLLLGFCKNTDRPLGNGLRYSCGTNVEINGELKIGGLDIVNRPLDLAVALRIARLNLKWEDVRRYCMLRQKQISGLTEVEHREMLAVKDRFGEHGREMVRLSREATRDDLRLAKWLSQ